MPIHLLALVSFGSWSAESILNSLPVWWLRRRDQFPGKTLGYITTHYSFGRGTHTGCEVDGQLGSSSGDTEPQPRSQHNFSWMDDENVVFAARGFCKWQGESEYIVPSH